MKRNILTGTPGSGKTSLLHALKSQGYSVIEEAATDVIALEQKRGNPDPWMQADFIDKIIRLQKQRQIEASMPADELQVYDPFANLYPGLEPVSWISSISLPARRNGEN